MTFDCAELDPFNWTGLQTEICMNVALAKRDALIAEAERVAEYGTDAIQAIMANALREAA